MIKLQLATLVLASSLAQAQSAPIPNETFIELQKFQSDRQVLSQNFVREFPVSVHQEILRGEKAFLKSLNGRCRDTIQVTFGPELMANKDSVEADFQKGLVKVEASKCFQNASPTDLIEISADPNFKRRAFSTLEKITSQGNQDCEWTKAPTIGRSHYCYLNFDLEKTEDVRSQVNFLSFNDDTQGFDAPVYYREAFVSARRMGPQTLYYIQSYVRATALSSFKKIFAENYIKKSQEQVFAELEKSLQKKGSN